MPAPTIGSGQRRGVRALWRSLSGGQKRTLSRMALVVGALHAVGFLTLISLVVPSHYAPGGAGALTIGVGVTAYALGLRHAFDADHIAAIDNTTRKLMSQGKRPLSVGFWFSLGHSTIVFALAFAISLGARALAGPVEDRSSSLHQVTNWIGTLVSGSFLYAIAAINVVTLWGVVKVSREIRAGRHNEDQLERRLNERGFINRVLGSLTGAITRPSQMFPIGLLFGLGFDTATEVTLLVLAGGAAGAGLPWSAILCLAILFAAGMSLMDSIDGSLMALAYGWAFSKPARRVCYNITITSLSIAVALVIGTIELGGLTASKLNLSGPFWTWFEGIDVNFLGLVIVGMFAATWVIALTTWHLGRGRSAPQRPRRRNPGAMAAVAPVARRR